MGFSPGTKGKLWKWPWIAHPFPHRRFIGRDRYTQSDRPKARVIKAFHALGFEVVREGNHIAMVRENPDGSHTPLTMPSHKTLKSSTLRTISLPLQVQILEPDFIDSRKHRALEGGRRIVRGIDDALGRRLGYWLCKNHPRSSTISTARSLSESSRVPASEILHVFKMKRPGQVRGASWFAPVLIRFTDFDEFADATLMKQKIAACLAVITSDVSDEE